MPNTMISKLDSIAKQKRVSRAQLIRDATSTWLKKERKFNKEDPFGILKSKPLDGISFQKNIRQEW